MLIDEVKRTVQDKKNEKEERLLSEGFKLFTKKGLKETSIQDIVNKANVAKGTFYLYFKDKYELRDVLIARKSQKLFNDALNALKKNYIEEDDCYGLNPYCSGRKNRIVLTTNNVTINQRS